LDSDIRAEAPNDFATFFAEHAHLSHIGLNGGKAAASFRKHAAASCPEHIKIAVLPSTSPAHAARSFTENCALWRAALPL
jgi:TDG/mug DNA glycosylase family protein